MKCFFSVFFTSFVFIALLFNFSFGQLPWHKYEQNPVLSPGSQGSWEDYAVYAPFVMKDGDTLKMWYTGLKSYDVHQIGYATSFDGVNWQRHPQNPVLKVGSTGNWDSEYVGYAKVLKIDGTYHMWFGGSDDAGANKVFYRGYATSPDGIHWTKYENNPVSQLGDAGEWDSGTGAGHSYFFDGDTFHTWYGGADNVEFRQSRIGYAISLDGIDWIKYAQNPIFSGSDGDWDSYSVTAPHVIVKESGYNMWYQGNDGSEHWRIGYAISPDGITWSALDLPVLDIGASGAWDEQSVNNPHVLVFNNQYHLWYIGYDYGTPNYSYHIGYATAPVVLTVPFEYETIQQAIDAAEDGNIVLVDEGTYYENINFKGKAITVASHFLIDEDIRHISKTIINGSQNSHVDSGSVVTFNSGEDTNSVVCGFTITGGTGTRLTWPGIGNWHGGGGIVVEKCGAKIVHNIITGNSLNRNTSFGAGIDISGDSRSDYVIIQENLIKNNTITNATDAGGAGAAMYTKGTIEFKSNFVRDNIQYGSHHSWGAGLCIDGTFNLDGDLWINDNVFKSNQASGPNASGGAIFIQNSQAFFYNNVIIENHSEVAGGGFQVHYQSSHDWPGPPILINNTITNNKAQYGGAIEISGPASGSDSGNAVVINSILWENSASIADDEINLYRNAKIEIAFCNIAGGWPGGSNMAADPLLEHTFQSPDDTMFCCLKMNSPCIDAGSPLAFFDDLESHISAGMAQWPAMGTLRNDMGVHGGPHHFNMALLPDSVEKVLSVQNDNDRLPQTYDLMQNYPNPFNPNTQISFSIPQPDKVTLEVFNTLGQKIDVLLNKKMSAGTHSMHYNGDHLSSGVYFYKITAGKFTRVRKMVLIK